MIPARLTRFFPWIYFALFLAVIVFLNACYSFCSDDYHYGLNVAKASETVTPRLKTLGEVFFVNFVVAGYRPIVHFFARFFVGLVGHTGWVIANSAMMGIFSLLFYRLAFHQWRLVGRNLILLLACIFLILCKGESYLWCAGSVNYLWAGTAHLGFWLIHERLDLASLAKWKLLLVAIVAFFVGWTQEAFVLPTGFAFAFFYLFQLKRLTRAKVTVLSCYALGAILLVLKSMGRCETIEPFTLIDFIGNQLKICFALKGVWLLLLLFLFTRDKGVFFKRNLLELLVILGSYLMISVVGFNGERSLWAANLFAILILLREFKPWPFLTPLLGGGLVALWIALLPIARQLKTNFDLFITTYLNTPSCVTCHERMDCGPFARFFYQHIYTWQPSWNRSLAHYYGRAEEPIAFSKELYHTFYQEDRFCIPENRLPIPGEFYTTPTANTIVMPIREKTFPFGAQMTVSVQYNHAPGRLAWFKREFAIRRNPPIPSIKHPYCLKTPHGDYLLIGKLPGCDVEIETITLTSKQHP